jgi:hypothetical protein
VGAGVEILDDLALVPDVIPSRQNADAEFEKLFGYLRSEAEPAGGIFRVGDDEVDVVLGHDLMHTLADDGASGPAKNVTDKEKAQTEGLPIPTKDLYGNTRSRNASVQV